MRRRVVCPRSHPASRYLRRLSGAFAMARSMSRGTTPPEPPDGSPAPQAFTCGPGSGRHPCGPRAAAVPEPVAAGHSAPPRFPPTSLLCCARSLSACGVRTALSQLTRPQPRLGTARPLLEPAASRKCPAKPGAATAGGCLGAEFCPRPGHPPDVASSQPEARRTWVGGARSPVRARLTHRRPPGGCQVRNASCQRPRAYLRQPPRH